MYNNAGFDREKYMCVCVSYSSFLQFSHFWYIKNAGFERERSTHEIQIRCKNKKQQPKQKIESTKSFSVWLQKMLPGHGGDIQGHRVKVKVTKRSAVMPSGSAWRREYAYQTCILSLVPSRNYRKDEVWELILRQTENNTYAPKHLIERHKNSSTGKAYEKISLCYKTTGYWK